MGILALRQKCRGEELDYGFLMDYFKKYRAPRSKIMRLIRSGELIRVKKGLYVFGDLYRKQPVHRGLLANLIYGPSYVSKEYALSYYGMIPERVEAVTSMTTKKNKTFHTPFGTFTYQHLHERRYAVGVNWVELEEGRHFFLASPEKALADIVVSFRDIRSKKEMATHLRENLRIDESALGELDRSRMHKIAAEYRNPVVTLLERTLNPGL
ncbi:MAG: hypothetical protein K940chlam7_01053 [Chlamydiae bacterium]|nr:hypothetical protein [Chlamydiota bacterium]